MNCENFVQDYAKSVYHALNKALPDIEYDWRDWKTKEITKRTRRPDECDIKVQSWMQTFGNTAALFSRPDGIAGAARTTSLIVDIECGQFHYIYCDGKFVYAVMPDLEFDRDRKERKLRTLGEAEKQYVVIDMFPEVYS